MRPYDHLAGDPVLARLIGEVGEPDPFAWFSPGRFGPTHFSGLVLHVVSQQISTAVAFTFFDRIKAAAGGFPTPEAILAMGAERLRECGLSGAKTAYLLDLAHRQARGLLDLDGLAGLADAEVVAALTEVKGVGVWTAQSFLIAQLHRPDVLPAGDQGIRRAVERAWQLEGLPSIAEVQARGLPWAPYRTYAAALLWRYFYGA
ncbi:DNA-3-methyladenine glycosylase family protein [Herbidospora daliensis]|uniref:DNA-3-methyladenine glycosylase family protein n=1 Tax=Herbidospora daliensis TaxID=295585 RepID=UPI0007863753|nr:DNA-3-methyladenine glycosylase [Herbidospora daliensis]